MESLSPDTGFDAETAAIYDAGCDAPSDMCLTRLQALADGGPVLEFAVGTGRLALPLAARGLPVSGLELSRPMLDVLAAKPGAGAVATVQGDMTSTRVPGEFALVILVFNTIGNILTQDGQIACFQNAARHLRPGGGFVIENYVPPLRLFPQGAKAVPFDISETHSGFDTLDPATQQLVSHHYTRQPDGTQRYSTCAQRYTWPSELDLMARLAGLRLSDRWADWSKAPFDSDSQNHVSVYRKVNATDN